MLDLGAFWGDSALVFSQNYNFNRIYSFEPDGKNYQALKATCQQFRLKNVIPVKKGVGAEVKRCPFCSRAAASQINARGDSSIEITTIDQFAAESPQPKTAGVIKMDIEGQEYDAICGATETIKRCRPILLISIYHTGRDFFDIKPLIEKICPDVYHFIVRKLDPFHLTLDTTLLAWPKRSYETGL
jgi:FkbM family methyltransferase